MKTTKRTVTLGNFYDSRQGGHTYAMYTSGYDICITEGMSEYFYQLRNFEVDVVTPISPVMLEESEQINWEDLNENVRRTHFYALYPNGSEEELNLFVYGSEKGAEMNAINIWADMHLVYDRETTLRLREELGEFKKFEFIKSFSRWAGSGYKNYVYVIDDKWQVTVSANNYEHGKFYTSYIIEDYSKIVAQRKVFGRRVARLAKQAGVPWDIAVFVGYIESDEEAIETLKQVKESTKKVDEDLRWELSCGIGRRVFAIQHILGEETWEKLDCRGQSRTATLADYLSAK